MPLQETADGGCCGGKPCGGGICSPEANLVDSRYPRPPLAVDPSVWARGDGTDQFVGYASGLPGPSPEPYTYAGAQLGAFAFPIGGFGAGHVVLRGDGTLQKWCTLNQVRKEGQPLDCMPGCFFGISSGGQSYVLASPETYTEEHCRLPMCKPAHVAEASIVRLKALPGVKSLSVVARYPVADVAYDIVGFPVSVSMRALSPMVPQDDEASALPCAIFSFTLNNTSSAPQTVRLLQSQMNFVGWDGQADCTKVGGTPFWSGNVNTPFGAHNPGCCGRSELGDGISGGLIMTCSSVKPTAPTAGSIAVGALQASAEVAASIIVGEADEHALWKAFVAAADVPVAKAAATSPSGPGASWCGGVVQTVTLPAGSKTSLTFALGWSFPNRTKAYSGIGKRWDKILTDELLGNRYAEWFGDAKEVLQHVGSKLSYLVGTTELYTDTMYSSSIPWQLLDSAAGRAAVLRSPTMWWTKDGIVMGSEGNGCCPLNCSHVYGYTTLMERLYPNLAKDMRLSDFVRNFDPRFGVTMRFGTNGFAIDGALASIIKTLLVVQQSDSTLTFLRQVWPNIKAQLTILREKFDVDGDGVIRCGQPNTYDSAMFEANTFIGSYYVTALRAGARLATLLSDTELAATYAKRAELSAASYDKICWKEAFGYYVADVTIKTCKYSYGPGCFTDQLCAAGLSAACGFGYVFDAAHEASARKAIARYNVVSKPPWNDLQKHLFDGDTGVTVCTYPNGKLGDGMQYDSLVSSGFTSPVIAGLLLDGDVDEAERINKYIRARHDGRNRTPWNEPECDLLYSRAMAHWNIFDQAVGFTYDCTAAHIGFAPRYQPTAFTCFFIAEGGWGQFEQAGTAGLASGKASLHVLFGCISVASIGLETTATSATASVDDKVVSASISKGVVTFATTVTVSASTKLTVTLGGGSVALDVPQTKDVEPFQTASGVRQRRSDMSSRTATEMPTTSARAVQKKMPKLISQESALLAACGTVLFFLGALCGNALGAHPAS